MKKFISFLCFTSILFTGCGQIDESYEVHEESTQETTAEEITEETTTEKITEEVMEEKTEVKTTDIILWCDTNEILIDYDSNIVTFKAQTNADVEEIPIIDYDTGEVATVISDMADGIKGDGLFTGQLEVNTDIDTNSDVSEDVYYYYYAELPNGEQSEIIEIWVLEPFTNKELDDLERLDNAIEDVITSKEYKKISNEERAEKILAVLEEFEAEGVIERGSIYVDDNFHDITYKTSSGMHCAIMLDDMDKNVN